MESQQSIFSKILNLLTSDAEMKRLSGLGSKKRQAEPLTTEEENMLWEKGLLGSKDPQTSSSVLSML